jgi:hypothetical protein
MGRGEVEAMGGPWRDRAYDLTAWRPPLPGASAAGQAPASEAAWDNLLGLVISYLASVLTSTLIVVSLLKHWW